MKQIPFARGVGLGISVGVAHGQMGEDALGDVMQSMAEGEIQVLVCTKSKVGKTIKAVSDVMEDLTDAIGL